MRSLERRLLLERMRADILLRGVNQFTSLMPENSNFGSDAATELGGWLFERMRGDNSCSVTSASWAHD